MNRSTLTIAALCALMGCQNVFPSGVAEIMIDRNDQDRDGYQPPEDCDDLDSSIHPGAEDIPGDGIDQDCDGKGGQTGDTGDADIDTDTDADSDADSDADTDTDTTDTGCLAEPEICDGLDQDCDGYVDEDLVVIDYWADDDLDGFGDPADQVSACASPPGYVELTGDCNDNDPDLSPGEAEVCDGVDQDCDVLIDEGLAITPYCADADVDGFGDPNVVSNACAWPAGTVLDCTDCDDKLQSINPGETEVAYDGIDQDCLAGDLCDVDLDTVDATACGGDDCDDNDPNVNANEVEVPNNGLDDDCDPATLDVVPLLCVTVDPAVTGPVTIYVFETNNNNIVYWVDPTNVPVTGTPFMSGDASAPICRDMSVIPYSTGHTLLVLGVWDNGSEVSLVNGNAMVGYTSEFVDITLFGTPLPCAATSSLPAAPYAYMSCVLP